MHASHFRLQFRFSCAVVAPVTVQNDGRAARDIAVEGGHDDIAAAILAEVVCCYCIVLLETCGHRHGQTHTQTQTHRRTDTGTDTDIQTHRRTDAQTQTQTHKRSTPLH